MKIAFRGPFSEVLPELPDWSVPLPLTTRRVFSVQMNEIPYTVRVGRMSTTAPAITNELTVGKDKVGTHEVHGAWVDIVLVDSVSVAVTHSMEQSIPK
jgi:hypothetical protein